MTAYDAILGSYPPIGNERSGGHFFTTNEAERDNVIANLSDYAYEGVAFFA